MSLPRLDRRTVGLCLLIVLVGLVVAGCATGTTGSPGASGAPHPSPTPLTPASPGADPISLLAFVFTPVFQLLFIVLAAAGVATLWMAIAADMGASLLVIFNGLRLTKQGRSDRL